MKNNRKLLKSEEGFTLLETLIALSVIVVGALGVFALLNSTLITARTNKELIVSVNLAREGLEIVRSIRDSSSLGFAALANGDWIVDSSSNYSISTAADNTVISQCTNCQLYLTGGQYSHTASSEATVFKRLININDGSSFACAGACEKIVTVSVLRQGSVTPDQLVVHLTDWR
jgi:prepilin-type N-terminal cleavage/methylation domain-containing protein